MDEPGALGSLRGSTPRPWSLQLTMVAWLLLILVSQGAHVQSEAIEGSVEEPKITVEIELVDEEWLSSAQLKLVTKEALFDQETVELSQGDDSFAVFSPSLGPHKLRDLLASKRAQQVLPTTQAEAHKEGHATSQGVLGSYVFWSDTTRLEFSGRPSCPARSPSAEERRRRAAAATGRALLESQLQQQQRWILLQRRRNGNDSKTELPKEVQHSEQTLRPPAARVGISHCGADGPQRERPGVSLEAVGPGDPKLILPQSASKRPYSSGTPSGEQNEQHRSCPRARLGSPLLTKPVASTCKRPRVTDSLVNTRASEASFETVTHQTLDGADVREGPSLANGMRAVVGGLEASVEEEESLILLRIPLIPTSKKEFLPALTLRSIIPESASPSAGSRGAAMGEGEIPAMTWVLGATDEEADGASSSPAEEGENLLEAFEYSFSLHAEEVSREFLALGLKLGHAPAGAPQSATLQLSFDSVPLHEQRVIRTELGRARESLDGSLRGPLVLTPAQVQLQNSGSGEVLSLSEGGRTLSGSLFGEWIRALEGPEGAAALHLFSLSLEDLRVVLALQEETGGPLSLTTAEDWAESTELSPFLKPLGGANASFLWEEDLETYVGDPDEHGEDSLNTNEKADDSYWHWLTPDPTAW